MGKLYIPFTHVLLLASCILFSTNMIRQILWPRKLEGGRLTGKSHSVGGYINKPKSSTVGVPEFHICTHIAVFATMPSEIHQELAPYD